jgi:hypothetical protein
MKEEVINPRSTKLITPAHVDESDKDENCSKGMTSSEHMFVLSAAQTEKGTDDTDIEIDEYDLKDFRKRFKAVRKKIRKQIYGNK